MVDSGSWYTHVRWPHDGNPYEGRNFVVYSDAAGLEARQDVAEVAEDALAETVAELGVDPEAMFRFPAGQDKIHIYAYRDHYPQNWGMRTYYGGLIGWSLDHEERPTDLGHYEATLKHELVHVVEDLVKGGYAPHGSAVHRWFNEGLAEALTGGTSGGAIRGLDDLADLTAEYGQLNPIAWQRETGNVDSASFDPLVYFYYYYPMSQLAVEYLIDPDGYGKTPAELTRIFVDMAEGSTFPEAFERRVGMGLEAYEAQFFDLMDEYLQ